MIMMMRNVRDLHRGIHVGWKHFRCVFASALYSYDDMKVCIDFAHVHASLTCLALD
jgi:endonuclease IV